MKETLVIKLQPTDAQVPFLVHLALTCTKLWKIALYDSQQVWSTTGKIPTYAEICKNYKDQWLTKTFVAEAGEVGRKRPCRPRTQQVSVTSKSQSGDKIPSPVELSPQDGGVEPANRKLPL